MICYLLYDYDAHVVPLGPVPEHWSAAMRYARYELYACSITLKITWIVSFFLKKKHFLCFDFLLATIKQTEKWQLPTRLWGCLFCSLAYFSKSTRNRMEQIQSANICLCGECASLRVTENEILKHPSVHPCDHCGSKICVEVAEYLSILLKISCWVQYSPSNKPFVRNLNLQWKWVALNYIVE